MADYAVGLANRFARVGMRFATMIAASAITAVTRITFVDGMCAPLSKVPNGS